MRAFLSVVLTIGIATFQALSTAAAAERPKQPWATIDAAVTCGDFVRDYQDKATRTFPGSDFQMMMVYAEGFLTAVDMENSWRGGPSPSVVIRSGNRASRALYLYKYCSEHPFTPFPYAVSSMVHHLWKAWPSKWHEARNAKR